MITNLYYEHLRQNRIVRIENQRMDTYGYKNLMIFDVHVKELPKCFDIATNALNPRVPLPKNISEGRHPKFFLYFIAVLDNICFFFKSKPFGIKQKKKFGLNYSS